ncbi:hypothetical protein JCM14469_12300 [Desulfatiferula olefinivorans]
MKKLVIQGVVLIFLGTAVCWASDSVPVTAGGASDETGRMTVMMEQRRFSEETVMAACKVIEAARHEGLPTKPIMDKALEGMAKQVQERAVVRAMEQVRARYAEAFRYARSFAFSDKKNIEIGHAMAECMSAGLESREMKQVVERLRRRLENERGEGGQELVEQSVMTIRSMARMGLPSDMTGELIAAALEHQYNARDMRALRLGFQEQARSRSAAMVARDYTDALERGEGIGALGTSSTIGQGNARERGSQAEGGSSGGPGGRGNSGTGGRGGHGR